MEQDIAVILVEGNDSDAEMTIRAPKKNNLANRLLHLKDSPKAIDFLFAEFNKVISDLGLY